MKEFQTGQNNLTLWNDTYEEEKSNASASNSTTNSTTNLQTPGGQSSSNKPPGHNRVQQLHAGQMSTVSPSKALPLNINIPHQSSPNKFLPSKNYDGEDDILSMNSSKKVDSSGFLKSLSADRERKHSEESTSSQESSFLKFLESKSGIDQQHTVLGEVNMSQTMMDVSMFHHGDIDSDTDMDTTSTGKLDPGNFLAGLVANGAASNQDDAGANMLDMTGGSNLMDITKVGASNMNMTKIGDRNMDITRCSNVADVTRIGGGMDMTKIGGGMDMTRVGGHNMDMTRVSGQNLDMTRGADDIEDTTEIVDAQMEMTGSVGMEKLRNEVGNMEMTGIKGGNMEMTQVGRGGMEMTRIGGNGNTMGGDMEMTKIGGGNMEMTRIGGRNVGITNMETTRIGGANMEMTRVCGGNMELTRVGGGNMEMTQVGGGNMEMTRVGGGNMEMIRVGGGNMEMTRNDGGNMEMTRIGEGNMEMTRIGGGNMEMTRIGGGNMEMTRIGGGNMELTHVAGGSMEMSRIGGSMELTRSISVHQPNIDELPGSEPSSTNNSMDGQDIGDYGGATATVKFSVLSLANNTLILPRKESEEDDMTSAPVQYFSYDPQKPIKSTFDDENVKEVNQKEKESQPHKEVEESPAPSSDISLSAPSSREQSKATDESGWETMHSMIGLPPVTESSDTPSMPQTKTLPRRSRGSSSSAAGVSDQVQIAEEQSPEKTTCLGGLLLQNQNLKHFSDADLTSFFPAEESTRAFNLDVLSSTKVTRTGADILEESPEARSLDSDSDPVLNMKDITFSPRSESTRAFKPLQVRSSTKFISEPLKEIMEASDKNTEDDEKMTLITSNDVDVTRPGSQLGHYQNPETILSGLEVTAAPGDCDCHNHHAVGAGGHQGHCINNKSNVKTGQTHSLSEKEESPPKKLKLDLSHESNSADYDARKEDGTIEDDNDDEVFETPTNANLPPVGQQEVVISENTSSHFKENTSRSSPMKLQVNDSQSATTLPRNVESGDLSNETSHPSPEKEKSLPLSPEKEKNEVKDKSNTINGNNFDNVNDVEEQFEEMVMKEKLPVEDLAVQEINGIEVVEEKMEVIEETNIRELGEDVNEVKEESRIKKISIFSDLETKQSNAGKRDWKIVCENEIIAAFSFLENTLLLILELGEKLEPKKSRKSLGIIVNHWKIRNVKLESVHQVEEFQSENKTILDAG